MSELMPAQPAVPFPPDPNGHGCADASRVASPPTPAMAQAPEPVLCQHCGRTASNGISCEGACVADSGY